MLFVSDSEEFGIIPEIINTLGFDVRVGWNERENKTYYCEVAGSAMYRVYVWNRTGVRAELAIALGMPVWR